jgi:hypothetical protein
MANRLHAFKDRDVQRVIKAARSAGLDPVAVEVDPKTGRIKVTTGKPSEAHGGDLDKWMAKRGKDARPA